LILNNKGELYVDTTLYANGVEEIFELNGSDIMIIYQDGTLEGYNSRDDNLKVEKVDKALYGENYIAKLTNHELTVYLIKEVDQGESYCLKFNNVDDIEYNKDMACLTIKSADGSIDFPVYSLAKLS
jgi:hypothetical protein